MIALHVYYQPLLFPIILASRGYYSDGIEYIASGNIDYNAKFEQALSSALNNTLLQEGRVVFNFEVDAGVLLGDPLTNHSVHSLYWYYLIDRINGDIAPLRYHGANLQDKIYGYIDDEGME